VTEDTQLARDEECQLLATSEACQAKEHALAAQLLQLRNGLRCPAYMRLVDAYKAIRTECWEKWLAVRTHRKQTRDEGE
jgi:hypothetical protein